MKEKNKKNLIGVGVGMAIGSTLAAGGAVYASTVAASSVSYSNSSSGISSTTVQGAIDTLYSSTSDLNALKKGIYKSCISSTSYKSYATCEEYGKVAYSGCKSTGQTEATCQSEKSKYELKCEKAVGYCITSHCSSQTACCKAVMPNISGCC